MGDELQHYQVHSSPYSTVLLHLGRDKIERIWAVVPIFYVIVLT
jgi:hypothetical protein